ncbi:MAG: hypothetical protein ACPL7J_13255, partial [Desulfomonilaceae bacterium]
SSRWQSVAVGMARGGTAPSIAGRRVIWEQFTALATLQRLSRMWQSIWTRAQILSAIFVPNTEEPTLGISFLGLEFSRWVQSRR